jgi:uncharacterized protein YndB with AHSA1/START domain
MSAAALTTDRIEKAVRLAAPVSRVWRALTDHREFGQWFGVALDGPFVAGELVAGQFGGGCGSGSMRFEALVREITPETRFVYEWHPYAVDPAVDYGSEPRTRVEFTLTPDGDGTLLRVVESGFDRIPAHRRAEALRMNTGGWEMQMRNIAAHVA